MRLSPSDLLSTPWLALVFIRLHFTISQLNFSEKKLKITAMEEPLSSIDSTTTMAKLKEPLLITSEKGGFRAVSFIIGIYFVLSILITALFLPSYMNWRRWKVTNNPKLCETGSAALASAASGGVGPNMILYLTREYGMQSSGAANLLFFLAAATDFMAIVAAVIADSYVGRFRMVGFGSIASLMV